MADTESVSLSLKGATLLPSSGPFKPLLLDTSAGEIEARLYQPPTVTAPPSAIVWLGDAVGGFDSPADGLYDRLAERFAALGTASLRLQYRNPLDHAGAALDAMVAVFLLVNQGFGKIVVVGHGSGALGAVQAGVTFPAVTAVAAIAPAPFAGENVDRLAPKPLLVLQGTEDANVPTSVARALLEKAQEPKRIYYYQGADHSLAQVADAVDDELTEWLKEQLKA